MTSQAQNKHWWQKITNVEITSLLLFVILVVSNGTLIGYAKGYFDYYGIDLAAVNFTPQLYDYLRVVLPALLALAVVIPLYFLMIKLEVWALNKFQLTRQISVALHPFLFNKNIPPSNTRGTVDKIYSLLPLVTTMIIVFALPLYIAPHVGKDAAAKVKSYVSISKPNDKLQMLVIHRSEDHIIVKLYDTDKHSFDNGFKILSSEQNYQSYEIR